MKYQSVYKKKQKSYLFTLMFGVCLIVILFLLSLCYGSYRTTPLDVIYALIDSETNQQVYTIVSLSRFPRLIASMFVGASLSVAGVVYQELFSNKMASPDILGVSAGAGVGASISIYYGLNFILTSIISFVGGVCSVLLTIYVSKLFKKKNNDNYSLIMAGIIISGLMNSFLGLFKYLSNDSQLASITFWLLGGFYHISYNQLVYAIPIIVFGILVLYSIRWKIVMLRGGDKDAYSHGVNAKFIRAICIFFTTVITATSICISGTIGWVGLAIPNLMRILVNNDGKKLIPLSIVYGMVFMMICDLLARSITNTEIPIGILTGIIGVIMFVIVLLFQSKKVN